jgi:poly-gamma-glutamate synthesis protein (capsule biosynthesis protein)
MSPPETVELLLAGDVMTGRGIDQLLPQPSDPLLHEPYVRDARDYVRLAERVHGPIERPVAPEYPWGDALAEIDRRAPDLRIANLETAVTTASTPWPGKGIHYRMHPANVGCLSAARIDACTLANNHVLDWGRDGLAETLATLRRAGIRTAGAGADAAEARAPATLPLPGARRLLLFASATASSGVAADWAATGERSGVALLADLSAATARRFVDEIGQWRGPGDRVVVSIHWGGNWVPEVPKAHREFAHRLVDSGAVDLVHGHSAHHPMPVEVYHGRLILYGCGDLINDYEGIGADHGGLRSDVGCLYFATLDAASGALLGLEVVPLQLKRLRLQAPDARACEWVDRLFCAARDGTPLAPGQSAGHTLRWPAG